MQCISPITVDSKKGKVHVKCGKCEPCLTGKRMAWTIRLKEELRGSASAFFITLTYDEDQLPLSPSGLAQVEKLDIQLFMKKLRRADEKAKASVKKLMEMPDAKKVLRTQYGIEYDSSTDGTLDKKLKYFCTSEYGPTTHRPHYHMVIFNLTPVMEKQLAKYWGTYNPTTQLRVSKELLICKLYYIGS